MRPRFADKRAIVTGAASGIGAAIAQSLADEGAVEVLALDLNELAYGQLADTTITYEPLDVSDELAVASAVDKAAATGPIDALFNVAGIGSTFTAPDTPTELWDRVMAVNARGTFLTCKYVIPKMAEHGRGAIVNVASVAGLIGLRQRAAYCASKGAVVALTRALAIDHIAEGVRVNCLCPGTVDSPWVRRLVSDAGESLEDLKARQPMGRLGTPREIAEAAIYLASDSAGFVTGAALTIDGGLTAA